MSGQDRPHDMRKLVVTENMTLDGVIDLAAGWFDPLAEDVDQSDINSAGRGGETPSRAGPSSTFNFPTSIGAS